MMSVKAARGTKRTCLNPECGARFYDLNRERPVCPICNTAYAIAVSTAATAAAAGDVRSARKTAKKPEFEVVDGLLPVDAPVVEGEEALAVVEGEEEAVTVQEDETFLEAEEEDGADVAGIIDSPVPEENEEP
jgi:uncharacterized protein (TIGR02300 family)